MSRRKTLAFPSIVIVLAGLLAGSTMAALAADGGGKIAATVRDAKGAAVLDAVVAAFPAGGAAKGNGGGRQREIIDQVDSEFVPEVKAIRAGSEVSFPNKDNTRHHVYSFSKPKKFELPLYKGVPADPVLFDRPGLVVLGCNIHDWMVGYLYVLETPYFAMTGKDGAASIEALPPGDYDVVVYHPRAKNPAEPAARRKISVADGAAGGVDFSISLAPDTRRNRAGRAGDVTYP